MSNATLLIVKAGRQTGPYSPEQIPALLESRTVSLGDLAWRPGMTEWQPLHCVLGVAPPLPSANAPARPAVPSAELEHFLIPVGRSPYAIAAGYCGLISILLLPAPFALAFGIMALKDIAKHPHKTGKVRAWLGIVSGALFSLLLLSMLLLNLTRRH